MPHAAVDALADLQLVHAAVDHVGPSGLLAEQVGAGGVRVPAGQVCHCDVDVDLHRCARRDLQLKTHNAAISRR